MNTKLNLGTEDISIIDNLIKDKQLSFIIKKIARLANALLYLSSVLSGHKPIKDKLESMALDLNNNVGQMLKTSLNLSNNTSVERHNLVSKSLPDSLEWSPVSSSLIATINLLNSALMIGVVSAKNYQVFSSEITGITQGINSFTKSATGTADKSGIDDKIKDSIFLSKSIFSVGRPTYRAVGSNTVNSTGDSVVNIKDKLQAGGITRKYYKRHIVKNPYSNPSGGTPGDLSGSMQTNKGRSVLNSQDLNKRQSDILSILGQNDNLSIKDFSLKISDCSEKTIQRELNYLTEMKIIGKTGAKRWTRYYLLRGAPGVGLGEVSQATGNTTI